MRWTSPRSWRLRCLCVVGEDQRPSDGGVVETLLWELPVLCLPTDIPSAIEIDVSGLSLDQALTVGELELPEGSGSPGRSRRAGCEGCSAAACRRGALKKLRVKRQKVRQNQQLKQLKKADQKSNSTLKREGYAQCHLPLCVSSDPRLEEVRT